MTNCEYKMVESKCVEHMQDMFKRIEKDFEIKAPKLEHVGGKLYRVSNEGFAVEGNAMECSLYVLGIVEGLTLALTKAVKKECANV